MIVISVLIAGVIGTAVIGIRGLNQLDGALETVVHEDLERFLLVTDLRKTMRSLCVLEQEHILENEAGAHTKIEEKLQSTRKGLLEKFERCKELVPPTDLGRLQELEQNYEKWNLIDIEVLTLSNQGRDQEAFALAKRNTPRSFSDWESIIKGLIDESKTSLDVRTRATKTVFLWQCKQIAIVCAMAVLLGLGVGYTIFRGISRALKNVIDLKEELAETNRGLEITVQERTRTIRTILDNVKSGFLMIDSDLNVKGGFTRSCHDLFGKPVQEGQAITDFVGLSARESSNFSLLLDQVFEDILPEELSLGQIQTTFEVSGKSLSMRGSLVRAEDGQVQAVLFSIDDISRLRRAEDENLSNRTLIKIMQERLAFLSFLSETKSTLELCYESIATGNHKQYRAGLHTVKGNSAAFGLSAIAQLIHSIENNPEMSKRDLESIEKAFHAFLLTHRDILKIDFEKSPEEVYLVPKSKVVDLYQDARRARDQQTLQKTVAQWLHQIQLKRVRELVSPLPFFVERLAERLEKSACLTLEGTELSLDSEMLGDVLQNLSHLLRNAVDHGIEAPCQRGDKPRVAALHLRFSEDEAGVTIELSDDGAGMDAEKLARVALEKNLLSPEKLARLSHEEKLQLIFLEGFSTASQVTDVSGRGVGMSAVAAAVSRCGGEISVWSELGRGSRFTLKIPHRSESIFPQSLAG